MRMIAAILAAALLPLSLCGQQTVSICGSWKSEYTESRDMYDLVLDNDFAFNADGTYSQTSDYYMEFHGKDHGNSKIRICSSGTYAVSGTTVFFTPDLGSVTSEMYETHMSGSLENIFRNIVVPKMAKRYRSSRSSEIVDLTAAQLVLLADDGRKAVYKRL